MPKQVTGNGLTLNGQTISGGFGSYNLETEMYYSPLISGWQYSCKIPFYNLPNLLKYLMEIFELIENRDRYKWLNRIIITYKLYKLTKVI